MYIKRLPFLLIVSFVASLFASSPMIALETRVLLQGCEDQDDVNFGFCMGFLAGMFEGYNLLTYYDEALATAQGRTFVQEYLCAPSNFYYEDLVPLFLEFLEENSGFLERQTDAEVAVHAFFSEPFFDCE